MSLRLKTILGVALIEAILLTILIVTIVSYMRSSAGDALIKRAQTTATLFATTAKDPVLSHDLASLDSFSQELLANPDLEYVRVLDSEGRLFSSVGDETALARAFIMDTSLEEVDDGILDFSAEITESGIVFGRVEIGINTDSVVSAIQHSRQLSITIAIIEMFLVAVFSFLLGTYLTRQLKVLRKTASEISKGNYSVQIPVKSNDEVAEVAHAFNRMTSVLLETRIARDAADEDLKELNHTLEDRVKRRTDEINKKIVELQSSNQKLAETQAKLVQSEKLASIGQLAAGIAHEINNPIGFVRSNLNTLSDYVQTYQKLNKLYKKRESHEGDENNLSVEIQNLEKKEDIEYINEDVTELISDAIEGTTRIRDIVQGLQDFSNTNEDGRSSCDINECITSVLKSVINELENKASIETNLSAVPLVSVNQDEINQVLVNILINAGHAIDNSGKITICTIARDGHIEISISDNGSGIREEDIGKLFDPFFTTKPVGQGTGLGLSISFGIINDHNGEISVESELGVGTTFTIRLPLDDSSIEQAA